MVTDRELKLLNDYVEGQLDIITEYSINRLKSYTELLNRVEKIYGDYKKVNLIYYSSIVQKIMDNIDEQEELENYRRSLKNEMERFTF